MKRPTAKYGFTLIELSIVIVIIALLIAGFSGGANLIKQAEVKSVIIDLQNLKTAYNNFIAKYNAVPGDMTNAASYWPNGACAQVDVDCNGNGDGKINASYFLLNIGPPGQPGDEVRTALKQLSLSGLIADGIAQVPDAVVPLVPGVNAPASKVSGVGYYIAEGDSPSAWGSSFTPNPSTYPSTVNVIFIGKTAPYSDDNLVYSAFTPLDAFNIDLKMDDGSIVTSMN
ncbi:MAG: prepilin-type N-terminal cleavage/methylation domain-containing protein, partial [Gammaproteobacteria bacterium]